MLKQTSRIYEYDLVAEISKAKGLDGQLVALELGRLSVLHPGLEVWIVPPTLDGVRHSFVTEATDDFKKRGVLIRLEGIDDRTKATELVGRHLLAPVDMAHGDGSCEPSKWLTRTVPMSHKLEQSFPLTFTDADYGSLGTLEEIKPGPAYDIWVILGPYGLLEIPAVDEYILEESAEQIKLSLPKGFIEITAQDKEGSRNAD